MHLAVAEPSIEARSQSPLWGWAQVALAFVCVLVFYAVFVPARIDEHGVRWFVHIGAQFLSTSTKSDVITPSVGAQSQIGYDGQYYYALAADPVHARYYMPGSAGYVYSRVLYPATARAFSLGSVDAIPYVMLAINLVAVGAGTLAVALWLRARGTPAWPAALFGLYPGMIFSAFRDLTEPLAFALVAFAVLAFDERRTGRLVASGALFALAALTRETVVPFALAGAAALTLADGAGRRTWRSARVWRRSLLFVAGTCGPLLIWRQVVAAYVHEPTQETGGGGWAIPFHGIVSYWPFDQQHRLIVLTVLLPTMAVTVGALFLLRRAPLPVALLLVNVLLYVVFLPVSVDVDYGAASRAAIGVVLAALYCLPAWRPRGVLSLTAAGVGAFALSVGWYLVIASHYGIDSLNLITA
jgi:Dolichyl-phosphate-mannose-protein mannosyltransferase